MSLARRLAAVLAVVPLVAAASPQMPGRAWLAAEPAPAFLRLSAPATTYRWSAPLAKSAAADDDRRTRVGFVRPPLKDFAGPQWRAVEGGFAARFDASSAGALGLRVRLDLAGTGELEIRVAGTRGPVESMTVRAGEDVAWGPWTEGETQAVEVFSRAPPGAGAVRVGGVVHFDRPLGGKAAGSCTIDASCTTGDAALDAAITERRKSMARITYVDGGRAFVCTGTLLDSEKYPTPYFLTANHCIGRAEVAASITSFWFYEATACGSGVLSAGYRQVAGGMSMDYADPNTDHSLLIMNAAPPSGTVFSGWNAAKLTAGAAVTSLSHPAGDVAKLALATVSGTARFPDWEQPAWLATFTRGIVQGGSSGSGLYTLSGGSLQLRAVLSATTIDSEGGLSCTNLDQLGVYNRFDLFYLQVARRLMASPPAVADDHGNRPEEATPVAVGPVEATLAARIDYAGDVDVFRIPVASAGTLVVRASGGMDTIGVLLDANGERIASNDDAQTSAVDFGLTQRVTPGTYYLAVSRWEAEGTGPYTLSFALAGVTENYTDLWWNPDESGWGINFNHQGDIVFATLFTYGPDGAPDWFVMSRGDRQPDGSFRGALYRARGPAFNAIPWSAITLAQVGTMQVSFAAADSGTLSYTVDGVTVTKQIRRQRFSTDTTCGWSAFDRSFSSNYQDLWWNRDESGWGINFAHQGDILFATLFTYGADGRSQWFVMSRGDRIGTSRSFQGPLYRAAGPPFDASPWRPVTLTQVGTMRADFPDGNTGTLTYTVNGVEVRKSLSRQVFSAPAPDCTSDD